MFLWNDELNLKNQNHFEYRHKFTSINVGLFDVLFREFSSLVCNVCLQQVIDFDSSFVSLKFLEYDFDVQIQIIDVFDHNTTIDLDFPLEIKTYLLKMLIDH